MNGNNRTGSWSGINSVKRGYDPDLLPGLETFFLSHVHKLTKPDSRGWSSGLCPFHTEKNPSFQVNIEHGGFKCLSCGASGKGIINFYKKLHGVDFKTACKDLGAWRDK